MAADKTAAMTAQTPLLGRIALHLKLITEDQLVAATREQGQSGKNLGAVMIELGFLSEAQLQQVLKARQQIVAKHKAKNAVAAADATPEVAPAAAARKAAAASAPKPRPAAPAGAPQQKAEPVAAAGARPAAKAAAPAAASGDAGELIALLQRGIAAGASDVHIHSGVPLRFRLHGRFEPVDPTPIDPETAERMVRSAFTPEQAALFDEAGELDFAYGVEGIGRFRVNVFRQQRGVDGVFRTIPATVPSLEELGLPTSLARFTNFHQGLVLVTGPANCGKSSTLAAMVDLVNEERRDHILTVEDPIEYLHPSKRCVVNQRTVGPHTDSFARALRAALREDPDVIVIGELRDLETISLALTAAETGHLVLGSIHTNSTIRTINRIVGVFPADQQDQIRNMVSESLRAVVSQRLVPTADGQGRIPALEVLVNNKAIGNLIRENKTFQILSILQTGSSQGMSLLDHSLSQLIAAGKITRDEALLHCLDPKRIGG
jgi:twitching motility protein PilT